MGCGRCRVAQGRGVCRPYALLVDGKAQQRWQHQVHTPGQARTASCKLGRHPRRTAWRAWSDCSWHQSHVAGAWHRTRAGRQDGQVGVPEGGVPAVVRPHAQRQLQRRRRQRALAQRVAELAALQQQRQRQASPGDETAGGAGRAAGGGAGTGVGIGAGAGMGAIAGECCWRCEARACLPVHALPVMPSTAPVRRMTGPPDQPEAESSCLA